MARDGRGAAARRLLEVGASLVEAGELLVRLPAPEEGLAVRPVAQDRVRRLDRLAPLLQLEAARSGVEVAGVQQLDDCLPARWEEASR